MSGPHPPIGSRRRWLASAAAYVAVLLLAALAVMSAQGVALDAAEALSERLAVGG